MVDEPSVEQAITMLRGLKPKLEVHHGVTISDAALVTAAVMSNRYISDRHLPDKAIDLVDEASASLRLRKESPPEELDALKRTITTLQIELSSLGKDTDAVAAERRVAIEEELSTLKKNADEMERKWRAERERAEEIRKTREEIERRRFELEEAQRKGDYQRASELRYSVLPELERKLPRDGEGDKGGEGARVTSDDIALVLAKATGIPTQTLMRGDRSRLLDLENVLSARVKGQEPAISAVASAIRLSRAGLHAGNRPVASFLFLGSTGTGKTEMAKTLAAELTGTEKNLVVINMSEFQDKHTVSRLIGASRTSPAGLASTDVSCFHRCSAWIRWFRGRGPVDRGHPPQAVQRAVARCVPSIRPGFHSLLTFPLASQTSSRRRIRTSPTSSCRCSTKGR
jgi:ATP-dependent Clp protease ATP-binding subunit ClpB